MNLADMSKSVVCYGLDESLVDQLLEHASSSVELKRWFVYGSNAQKLGILEEYWNRFTEVTMVITPPNLKLHDDFIELILEAQEVNLKDCYWVATTPPTDSLARKFSCCFDTSKFETFEEFIEKFCKKVNVLS